MYRCANSLLLPGPPDQRNDFFNRYTILDGEVAAFMNLSILDGRLLGKSDSEALLLSLGLGGGVGNGGGMGHAYAPKEVLIPIGYSLHMPGICCLFSTPLISKKSAHPEGCALMDSGRQGSGAGWL
jgi:hypothetical protein